MFYRYAFATIFRAEWHWLNVPLAHECKGSPAAARQISVSNGLAAAASVLTCGFG